MADIDIYKAKLPQDDTNLYRFRDGVIEPLVDTSYEETDYANPLTFETLQAQTAKNTKIKINPIQDLHGYSKPWVGGAGKNILPLVLADIKSANTSGTWSGNVYTLREGIFTVNLDSNENIISISAKNTVTTTDGTEISINIPTDKLYGNFYFDGGFSSKYDMYIWNKTTSARPKKWDGSSSINSSVNTTTLQEVQIPQNDNLQVRLRIQSNATAGEAIFYPMLCASTETDPIFAPYTNICPISGHDQIKIDGCGKNLVKFDSLSDYRTAKTNKVYVNGQETFTLSLKSIVKAAGIVAKDKNDVTVGEKGYSNTKLVSYTIPDGTDYVICYVGTSDAITKEIFNSLEVQLELGSSATTYEPYQESNNKTLDLPQTVYGGILDLENGEVVVDRKYFSLTGTSSENWNTVEPSGNNPRRFYSTNIPSLGVTTSTTFTAISNLFENTRSGSYDTINGVFILRYINNANRIDITCNEINSVANWQTYLASNNLQVCYELATPFTLYIPPEHLKLLKSQNNLTTSQYTQIKVTYRNGVFATLEELSDTANGIYEEISGDATTVSGNPINFTTREKQKSKSTIIDLEPIQDLHGFTKPWVGGAGKNLLPMTVEGLKETNTSGIWDGNVYTILGVKFTILTDSDNNVIGINANGTNTSQSSDSQFNIRFLNAISDGDYYFSGCPDGGSSTTYNVYPWDSTTNARMKMWNGTANADTCFQSSDYKEVKVVQNNIENIVLRVVKNTSISNKIFKPMICVSNASSPATFEPYTNIASISGRSSVDIDGCGKNLLDSSNGVLRQYTSDPTVLRWGYKPITLGAGTYTVTYTKESSYELYLVYTDDWSQVDLLPTGTSFTITKNREVFVRSALGSGNTENVFLTKFSNVQLEKSNQTTIYEPYTKSTDLTISFGTTVYGGRLDVEKGVLSVTHKQITMDGVTAGKKFEFKGAASNNNYYLKLFDGYLFGKTQTGDVSANEMEAALMFNSHYNYSERESSGIGFMAYIGDSVTSLQPRIIFGASSSITTVELANQWLADQNTAGTPWQFTYPLATPITIQLTPQQVQLLKGINNISTTGTTITVTFKNGSVAHLDDLPENVFTDLDKEKLASIDTLAVTLDLLTHAIVVTQDI